MTIDSASASTTMFSKGKIAPCPPMLGEHVSDHRKSSKVFSVSYAAAPAGSSQRIKPTQRVLLPFRDDLDAVSQVSRCYIDQIQAVQAIHQTTWLTTCTTRLNHFPILASLLGEGMRFRASTGLAPLSSMKVHALFQEIHEAGQQDAPLDAYVAALHALSAAHFFLS